MSRYAQTVKSGHRYCMSHSEDAQRFLRITITGLEEGSLPDPARDPTLDHRPLVRGVIHPHPNQFMILETFVLRQPSVLIPIRIVSPSKVLVPYW
jgi:hypothetical protein